MIRKMYSPNTLFVSPFVTEGIRVHAEPNVDMTCSPTPLNIKGNKIMFKLNNSQDGLICQHNESQL